MRTTRAERKVEVGPLTQDELRRMNAYWRAANYLSVGQIYLLDNPLLKRPLTIDDVKPRLLGHWGTTPGLNFVYVHLNRIIKERGLNMIFVCWAGARGAGGSRECLPGGNIQRVLPGHITQTPRE